MAGPEDRKFGPSVDKLVARSNTRGSGAAAPADSGQQAAIDTAIGGQRQSFGLSADQIAQSQSQLLSKLAVDKPKNFLDKSVLAGTKWGVIDVGGFKFVNPLKTIFSGLDTINQEVANPIAGLAIGNSATWLSQITNWSSAHKIADQFKAKMDLTTGDFWDQRSALKEFNEDRNALFWGEKFISSIVFDPTSYVGFGWAMKMPKLFIPYKGLVKVPGLSGKAIPVLGPLEKGWVDAWNLPFKAGAKAYRGETMFKMPNYFGGGEVGLPGILGKGIPLTAGQKAQLHGEKVFADVGEYFRQVSGKTLDDMTKADIQTGLAEIMDTSVHYNALQSDQARRLRDALFENPKLKGTQTSRIIEKLGGNTRVQVTGKQAGREADNPVLKEVVDYLQANGASIADDAGVRYAMSDLRDWYTLGRISKGEASEQLARLTGSPLDDLTRVKLEAQLDEWMTTSHRNAGFIVDGDTPRQLVEVMRSKAVKNFKADADNGFHERMQQLGTAGGLVQGLDNFQKALYQQKLRKWVVKPLATAVLTFPMFPLQERMETMMRQFLGQTTRGTLSRGQYNRLIGGNFVGPSSLQRGGDDFLNSQVQASRASLVSGVGGGDAKLKFDVIGKLLKTDKGAHLDRYEDKLRWLDPRHWLEQANKASVEGRRHFHTERIIKHHVASYGDELVLSDMKAFLNAPPGSLPKSEVDRLTNELAVAGMTGNPDAVRAIAEHYTGGVIQKVEVNKLIDNYASANDMAPSTRRTLETWADSDPTAGSIDKLMKQVEELEYDDFVNGLGGFEAQVDMSIGMLTSHEEMLKGIPHADRTAEMMIQAEHTAGSAITSLAGVEQRISKTLERATLRAREIGFTGPRKEAIMKRAQDQVNGTLNRMLKRKDEYVTAIKNLEAEAFDGAGYGLAEGFLDQYKILEDGWRLDRSSVEALFLEHKSVYGADGVKGESFWSEYAALRQENMGTMQAAKRRAEAVLEQKRNRWTEARGGTKPVPESEVISKRMAESKQYGIQDLAEISGVQGENITQAMMQGIWLNKADFVDHFVVRAGVNNIKGIDPKKIAGVYERIQKSLAIDDTLGNSFMQTKHNIRQFGDDLKGAAGSPTFQPSQENAVGEFVEGMAKKLEGKNPEEIAQIKALGQKGVDNATEDMNMAFVNYDGQRMIDDVMQNLMPFWTYESRRMPFLLRTAGTNPVIWNTFGPEGNYWKNTDDGYVHPSAAPWMDVNVFGGTLFNAPRRLKKGDMPPEHEGGLRGAISGAEQQMAQAGFYLGPHMTFLFDTILEGDLAEAAGQTAPPPLTGTLAGAQWLAESSNIPIVNSTMADALRKMRTAVMPDKFRDYEAAKIIWDMGFSPADVDFEKWAPREGSLITQGDINEALRRSAGVEWVRESSGMVRFRGESEREYRTSRDDIQMSWTGLNKSQLDEAKRQGIPLTSIVPMPPKVARILNELEGSEEFNASVALLGTGEKARIQNLSREMWDEYTTLKDDSDRDQAQDDLDWFTGAQAPSVWRDRMSTRKQAIGGFIDQSRGYERNQVTGEKVKLQGEFRFREVPTNYDDYIELQKKLGNDTIRLQHPTSQALEMYYGIAPVDRDGDGVPEWNEFFRNREAMMAQLPPELRREVLEEISEKQSEPERALAGLQRGILGRYWKVDEEVAKLMGVESLVRDLRVEKMRDPDAAKALGGLSIMKQYTKEVQRRKDLMRAQSAELDYSLNIFGFTGSSLKFKNPQAKLWWSTGNGVQKRVPYLGYLSGFEPPAAGEGE